MPPASGAATAGVQPGQHDEGLMADPTQAEFEAWAAGPPVLDDSNADMRLFINTFLDPAAAKDPNDYPRRKAVAMWRADDADGAKAAWLKGTADA